MRPAIELVYKYIEMHELMLTDLYNKLAQAKDYDSEGYKIDRQIGFVGAKLDGFKRLVKDLELMQ